MLTKFTLAPSPTDVANDHSPLRLDRELDLMLEQIAEPDGEVRNLGTIPNPAESIRKLNVGLRVG
jgi:hypothetical protein